MRAIIRSTTIVFAFFVAFSASCIAASLEVKKIDTTLLAEGNNGAAGNKGKVNVSVEWKSDNPVVMIKASGGKDIYELKDNVANANIQSPKGYMTGKASFTLDANYIEFVRTYVSEQYTSISNRDGRYTNYQQSYEPIQEAVVVTVVLVDEYGNESQKVERIVKRLLEVAPVAEAPLRGRDLVDPVVPEPRAPESGRPASSQGHFAYPETPPVSSQAALPVVMDAISNMISPSAGSPQPGNLAETGQNSAPAQQEVGVNGQPGGGGNTNESGGQVGGAVGTPENPAKNDLL